MNLCPTCGNKRCPRSTWHEHECSGSNDPGQEGSRYPASVCYGPLRVIYDAGSDGA